MSVDCQFIADHIPIKNKFNPKLPHKIWLFIEEPRIRFCLFRTGGKLVIFGGRSLADPEAACERLIGELQMWASVLNHPLQNVKLNAVIINNIVTSCNLGSAVHLQRMADTHDNANYETDVFPGLIYKHVVTNSEIGSTIYASGKCILYGCKTQKHIDDGWAAVKLLTQPYLLQGSGRMAQTHNEGV